MVRERVAVVGGVCEPEVAISVSQAPGHAPAIRGSGPGTNVGPISDAFLIWGWMNRRPAGPPDATMPACSHSRGHAAVIEDPRKVDRPRRLESPHNRRRAAGATRLMYLDVETVNSAGRLGRYASLWKPTEETTRNTPKTMTAIGQAKLRSSRGSISCHAIKPPITINSAPKTMPPEP